MSFADLKIYQMIIEDGTFPICKWAQTTLLYIEVGVCRQINYLFKWAIKWHIRVQPLLVLVAPSNASPASKAVGWKTCVGGPTLSGARAY
jgi:hypothetical protein